MKYAKILFLAFFLTFFGCVNFVCAQNTNAAGPEPAKTPADEDVVKINTDLIQLDVTVTDKNGNAVTGGKRQSVGQNAERHRLSQF